MKLETIKTFILTILVGLSLMLTFGIWNYQPNYELLYDTQSKYVNEVDLGGTELTKKDLIQPNSIIFHNEDVHYGFSDLEQQRNLYNEMQEWVFDDFRTNDAIALPEDKYQVEISFSEAIPMEIGKSLFTLDEKEALPDWSFKRIFITFNSEQSALNVYFLSSDEEHQVEYVVYDSNVYDRMWSYVNDHEGLDEFVSFGSEQPIYLPADQLEMNRQSLTVKNIQPEKLINALFNNPSLVSPNIGEAYFTDGQRGLRKLQDNHYMEFINPIHANGEHHNFMELLDSSMANINGHKGWTDEYRFAEINTGANLVRYRLHYHGYPVYNSSGLSIIEQEFRRLDIHQYRRPIFSLNNLLGEEVVKLPSGRDIVYYLANKGLYDESDIRDIQVGYRLTYLDSSSYSVALEPAWYMNYKGIWQEIKFDELEVHNEGGG